MSLRLVAMLSIGAMVCGLLSCGDTSTNNLPAKYNINELGKWDGSLGPLGDFKFEKIFAGVDSLDSGFTLMTFDPTRTNIPHLKDTTLKMTGTWRLNNRKDTIVLLSDTCVTVDTVKNVYYPRKVRGTKILLPVGISKLNDGNIQWEVAMADISPLASLIGLDLSGIDPSVLQVIKIDFIKTSN